MGIEECDICGKWASSRVLVVTSDGSQERALCAPHLKEFTDVVNDHMKLRLAPEYILQESTPNTTTK